jgi:hypothetical protein
MFLAEGEEKKVCVWEAVKGRSGKMKSHRGVAAQEKEKKMLSFFRVRFFFCFFVKIPPFA